MIKYCVVIWNYASLRIWAGGDYDSRFEQQRQTDESDIREVRQREADLNHHNTLNVLQLSQTAAARPPLQENIKKEQEEGKWIKRRNDKEVLRYSHWDDGSWQGSNYTENIWNVSL